MIKDFNYILIKIPSQKIYNFSYQNADFYANDSLLLIRFF